MTLAVVPNPPNNDPDHDAGMSADVLSTALTLASSGVPVLPLRAGKTPLGNCPACKETACGGRPHMKSAGTCQCPAPCHGWAAATTDPTVITSPAWAAAWHQAVAVAYHPGGAGLTVVDLDNTDAIAWAQGVLPPTQMVATTRGQHWIYCGAMRSANAVRPGVDIKSRMSYVRWRGRGTGPPVDLPHSVAELAGGEEATSRGRHAGVVSLDTPRRTWDRTVATGCRHTDRYVRTGLDRGLAMVRERTHHGAASQAFGVARFLAGLHVRCPGPCGLDRVGAEIVTAAVSVGVPEAYARRAVTNGLHTGGRLTA